LGNQAGKIHDHPAYPLGGNQAYKNNESDCLFDYCHKTKKLKQHDCRVDPQSNNDTTGSRLTNSMDVSTYMVGPKQNHKHQEGQHHTLPHP
jgi:hypothetical protein